MISANFFSPAPVNCIVTIGWFDLRVEVLPGTAQLEVGARHLRDLRRVVVQQVPQPRGRRPDARADVVRGTRDDDGARGYGEQLEPFRHLAAVLAQRHRLGRDRARGELFLRVEEPVLLRRSLCRKRLLTCEQRVHRVLRDWGAAGVDRGRCKIRLEVEELELRRLADDLRRGSGILDAGQLNRDLIVALLANLGLGDAEPVDAVAHDRDRAVEVGLRQRPVLRQHGLQRHLEPALKIEAECRFLVKRRATESPVSTTPTRARATSATTIVAARRVMCARKVAARRLRPLGGGRCVRVGGVVEVRRAVSVPVLSVLGVLVSGVVVLGRPALRPWRRLSGPHARGCPRRSRRSGLRRPLRPRSPGRCRRCHRP